MLKLFWSRFWPRPKSNMPNVIAETTEVRGDLRGVHGFRIDGRLIGTVTTESCVVVGPNGRVDGAVRAAEITVLGRVEGEVHSKGHLEIGTHGHLVGESTMASLLVQAGGVFRGQSRMSESDIARPALELPAAAPSVAGAERPRAESTEPWPVKTEEGSAAPPARSETKALGPMSVKVTVPGPPRLPRGIRKGAGGEAVDLTDDAVLHEAEDAHDRPTAVGEK